MSKTKRAKKHARSMSPLAAALAVVSLPVAQASVSVQQYAPAANSTYTLTEDALLEVAPNDPTWTGRRLFFSANYNWLNDAFIQYNESRTTRTDTLVDGVQTLDLGVGAFLDRNVSLNFSVPLNLVHLPSQGNRFALGDSRLFAKLRLTDDNAIVAVSLMPGLWLPTGDSSLYLTDGSLGVGASVAFERDFGPLRASANLGYRYSSHATFEEINYTQRLPMALGVFIPIDRKWGINTEASGSLPLPLNSFNNPGEVYAGARYQFNRDCTVLTGVSFGGFNSQAGNDVRLSAGIRFSPMPDPVYAAPVVFPPVPVVTPVAVAVPARKPRVIFTRKEIHISEEIKFEHDSAVLTASGKQVLDEVAAVMRKNKMSFRKVVIAGHTNELGSLPHNQVLSEQRAATVREYIASRGIPSKKLASIGYGKTKPKAGIKTLSRPARLAANRRVVFKVVN